MAERVRIIGGGLAGSEAAWQLIKTGIPVEIFEMRPEKSTKAHRTGNLAELVCSNSFRGADLSNAVGLLKEELRRSGSLVMEAADFAQVPAGGALAVDRAVFSQYIDTKLRSHPLVTVRTGEVTEVPPSDNANPVIVATGPLTSVALAQSIETLTGTGRLAFFDAISPILLAESIDTSQVFRQSRYDKGRGDEYLNIPLSREEYYRFIEEVTAAEKFGSHSEADSDLIENLRPFEGCMPIEEMIARGPDTLLFGPLKPVGLTDPSTGRRPFAVIQLRQDDKAGTLWSMVGMQTRMKHPEQLRIFRTLPGLAEAEFVRLGTVHRNILTFDHALVVKLDLTDRPAVEALIRDLSPRVVVHTAALTKTGACEREPELADLARRNCERNNLGTRVRVVLADVGAGGRALHEAEEQAGLVAGGFDHVVANPPYYTDGTGTPPAHRTRAVSHQMPARDLDRWMAFIATALRTGGRVTLIHRADALGEVLAALAGRFGGIEITPVHPRATEPASRIIVSAIKASKAPLVIRPALVVHDADGRYLPEIDAVLRRGAALQCNQS